MLLLLRWKVGLSLYIYTYTMHKYLPISPLFGAVVRISHSLPHQYHHLHADPQRQRLPLQ